VGAVQARLVERIRRYVSVKWPVRLQTTSSWIGDHTRLPARPAPSDPELSLDFICPPNPRLTREGQVLGGFDYLEVCINWRAEHLMEARRYAATHRSSVAAGGPPRSGNFRSPRPPSDGVGVQLLTG
jgi:hypothetical protein